MQEKQKEVNADTALPSKINFIGFHPKQTEIREQN
jgi:hypothetical protein